MARETRIRPMYVSELEALEIVLSHSDMEAVWLDWIDRGEPDYHFWPYLRTVLDYLKTMKPDTPLNYPRIIQRVIPVTPEDQQEILVIND